ncbi:hypothetical protein CPC08DRAFT_264420 [Agrocybe pediades]|nr:hypothetical protein CPC08DRAFT_264420 [Agrocybe pediades]
MRLLRTLAIAPRLCKLIKSFGVVHQKLLNTKPLEQAHSKDVIVMLRTILKNANSLRELRALLYSNEEYDWAGDLQDILCSNTHPRLRPIYFPLGVDYLQIIRAHPELVMLGIFIPHGVAVTFTDPHIGHMLGEIKKITDAVDSIPSLPIIFSFRHGYPSMIEDSFFESEDFNEIPWLLTNAFIEELSFFLELIPAHTKENFLEQVSVFLGVGEDIYKLASSARFVSFFLTESFDADTIYAISEIITKLGFEVLSLYFYVQDNFDMDQLDLIRILKHYSSITELRFKLWPDMDGKPQFISELLQDHVRKSLAKKALEECFNLMFIETMDGYMVEFPRNSDSDEPPDPDTQWSPIVLHDMSDDEQDVMNDISIEEGDTSATPDEETSGEEMSESEVQVEETVDD